MTGVADRQRALERLGTPPERARVIAPPRKPGGAFTWNV